MIKKYYLLIVLFIFLGKVFGQLQTSIPNVMLPSPTAMQFQRYGDYPVDNFTGVPSISIPIYTINEGDIHIPITLNYHASGCRPDDVSGFVGLGWTLSVGGMLTRTVNGLPDEDRPFLIPSQTAQNIQWWGNDEELLDQLDNGLYDHEYDIWSYNFLGNSGKYINAGSNVFFIENKNNIKVENNNLAIDANGVKYYFGGGGGLETTRYTDPLNSQIFKEATTGMPLSAIQSATDPSNYVSYTYQTAANYSKEIPVNVFNYEDFWNGCVVFYSSNFQYTYANNGGINQSSYNMFNQTYAPKEIVFRSGKIKFNQNPSTLMLSNIEIFNAQNELIKKIVFNIAPFPGSVTTNIYANNKLQSISFNNTQNNTVEAYSFNYYSENAVNAKPWAYTPTSGKDYWGFYNGDDGHVTRIPQITNFLTRGDCGSNSYGTIGGDPTLAPSETYAMNYILNKITYPTGGYTTLEFEGNRDNYNNLVGGIRIKTINSYSANSQLASSKNYTYNCLGIREIIPSVNDYILGSQCYYGWGGPAINNIYSRRIRVSENPVLGYSPKGSPITYDIVTESNGTGSITYAYDNNPAYTYDEINYPAVNQLNSVPASGWEFYKKFANHYKPWNFGNLISKSVSSNTNQVQGEEFEYEEYSLGTLRDFVMDRWMDHDCLLQMNSSYVCDYPCSSGNFDMCFPTTAAKNVFNYADRYYESGGKRVKKKITYYSGVTSTTDYFYDNPQKQNIPTREVTVNSKGESITTNLKYPFDFATSPYDEMVNRNIINPVIEQTQTNTTLSKQLNKAKTNYAFWQSNTIIAPSTIQKSILGNALETEATINDYDNKGNIKQVTGKDGVIISYIWGYNQQYPVAKVVNKPYSDAVAQSGVDLAILNAPANETVLRTELNKLRSLTNSFVTTYTYKSLIGITSETDPNGKTIYYEYDAFNRLILIRDKDNNILKKICYNYAGQPENCTVPCTNFTSNWQNTTTALRCQQGTCGNTGYQEQEQKDINPCSSTYNQYRWITAGYNPSACALSTCVSITSTNTNSSPGFTASYYNTATGFTYNFAISTSSGLQTLGTIPAGNYTLTISKPGSNMSMTFKSGCFKQTIVGTSAIFYNVGVSNSTCNSITISNNVE